MEIPIKQLVTEIIGRLTPRLGADGHQGRILVAVSAATVSFSEAMVQLRQMVLKGYQLELAFSAHARDLHREGIMDQLAGFPHVTEIDPHGWLGALTQARAVVIPLLSLNTASKAALLIADTLPTNLAVHGLAVGKPVIMATNGADPQGRHWSGLGDGSPLPQGFIKTIRNRFAQLEEIGCRLVDVSRLSSSLDESLAGPDRLSIPAPKATRSPEERKAWAVKEHTITVAHVRQAQFQGLNICLPNKAVVTPLAREIAQQHQVALISCFKPGA